MIDRKFITVMFSCECGLTDVEVKVRAREKHEDVKYYVEQVISREVAHVHFLKSGGKCSLPKMKYLKIPMPPDNDPDPWIGKWNSVSTFRPA